jgi:hypothetical protein
MSKDKGTFAELGKAILGASKPTGLSDFLDTEADSESVRKQVNTETCAIKSSTGKTAREEFRLTKDLAERLRRYAFDKRMKKTDAIIKALEELFGREGY